MVSNMWKSPIEIQQDIVRQVDMVIEDGVMKAIQRFDINVDKEELLKALQYDRGQYEKGYQDGVTDTNVGSKWIPCSERLPKIRESLHTSKCVLTTMVCDDGNIGVRVGFYHREIGWVNVTSDEKVIAWMPLPEPYKGE